MSHIVEWCDRRTFVWTVRTPKTGERLNTIQWSPQLAYEGQRFRLHFLRRKKHYSLALADDKYRAIRLPFAVDVYVENVLLYGARSLARRKYSRSCNYSMWDYSEDEILKDVPNFQHEGRLTFLVSFHGRVLSGTELDPPKASNASTLEMNEKSVQTSAYQNEVPCLESLSEDLSKLLEHDPGSDLVLTCGDLKVKAHKNLLCARSSVFQAMLNIDMEESRTGTVNIEDMDQDTFDPFVRYLYSGKLPDLTVDTAKCFYEVADKYAIDGLSKRCRSFLLENLDPENACQVLVLADAHSDADFKEGVVDYILQNEIHLQQDDGWMNFCKSQPLLALEVSNRVFKHLAGK